MNNQFMAYEFVGYLHPEGLTKAQKVILKRYKMISLSVHLVFLGTTAARNLWDILRNQLR